MLSSILPVHSHLHIVFGMRSMNCPLAGEISEKEGCKHRLPTGHGRPLVAQWTSYSISL